MGAEYPYVPSHASPADLGSLNFWAQSEYERISIALMGIEEDYNFLVGNRMKWQGAWTPGEYKKNDVVEDSGWLMIANKTTSERAGVVPTGPSEWVTEREGTISFADLTANEATYFTGNRFTITTAGYINGYRVWCPESSGNFTYEVWSALAPSSSAQQVIAPFVPSSVGWTEIPISSIIAAGSILDIILVVRAQTLASTFSALWQTKNENSNPSSGEAIFRNSATEIRISNTDKNDINQEANLALIEVGGTLAFAGTTWTITNITTTGSGAGGRHNFFIEPNQGRPSEGEYTLVFNWGAADPVPYSVDSGFYSANPNIEGFADNTYPPPATNQNAYGVDLYVQEAAAPEDWDFMAYSGESAGGGGTGSAEWGAITGDISLQTDMQDEFINKSGDTWEQGVTQVFPNDFAGAPDSSDAEVAWINFFGVNAWRVQAATPGTPNGVAYLFLTDRQNESFPFIVGSKYNGFRVRFQNFDDPDAIATVSYVDGKYMIGAGDTWDADATISYDPPASLPSAPIADHYYGNVLGVNGMVFAPQSGTMGYLFSQGTGAAALGANPTVGWTVENQVFTDDDAIITKAYADANYGPLPPGTIDGGNIRWTGSAYAATEAIITSSNGRAVGIGQENPIDYGATWQSLDIGGSNGKAGAILVRNDINTGNLSMYSTGVSAFIETNGASNNISLRHVGGSHGIQIGETYLFLGGTLVATGNGIGNATHYVNPEAAGVGQFAFLKPGVNAFQGGLEYDNATDTLGIHANNTEYITIASNGATTIDGQVTIDGGLTGGLIINGSGADVSLNCVGQIVAQGGIAGVALNAANNKITSLANGTATGDAVNLGQLDLKYDKSGGLIDGQVEIDGGLTGGLIVTGSGAGFSIDATGVVLGRSGFNANSSKIVAVAAGTNTGDAVNRGQLNGKANVSHTHAASDVTSGVFDDDRIPALLDKQMTIGGGTSGGLIVTGTGAGYSIDASGVIFGRSGMNAGNSLITAVATPTGATNAANKSYVDAAVSDERLKMNISDDVDSSIIHALNVYSYEYNYDKVDFPLSPKYREGRKYGVMAQEAEGVLPEAVYDSTFEGYKAFDYEMLVPLLLKEVQRLHKRIEALE